MWLARLSIDEDGRRMLVKVGHRDCCTAEISGLVTAVVARSATPLTIAQVLGPASGAWQFGCCISGLHDDPARVSTGEAVPKAVRRLWPGTAQSPKRKRRL